MVAALRNLRPEANVYRTTYRLGRADGSVVTLEETGRGFFDAQGKLVRVIGIAADVTAREQAQQALRWEMAVNEAVSHLSTPLISPEATVEKVADAVLEQALRLTGSQEGLVSVIDPATKENVCHALTPALRDRCHTTAADGRLAFPLKPDGQYEGAWCQMLNSRRAFTPTSPGWPRPPRSICPCRVG